MSSFSLNVPKSLSASMLPGVLLFMLATLIASAQVEKAHVIRIDASRPVSEPIKAHYNLGSAVSPDGHKLGLNSRYLTRDGEPWLPVMGEFHYSRYPRAQWEEELLKMKSAGVNIVATYVIWIHHEEIEGQFDWGGQRDLRAFALLCAKHGLLLEPRIGPWAHAEARNGGLPDWVVKRGPTRINNPIYLAEAGRWYAEIGRQLKGLMWKEGGPVVAIQLENEYSARGPGAGEEHILTLKQMAIEAGLDVPYYFVTGWDNAVVPEPAVIPIYGGGYPDAPWDRSITKLPPSEVYAFRFQSRVSANMGAIGAVGETEVHQSLPAEVPYLTAEIGGGIEDTYHRRPVIQPDDIGAMFPVMLGSGVNLYGTYMFHGGENPEGKLTTLEESQATGYPNDLPIKSYDFQAPLGAYGQERTSLGKMKVYQYFLNSFGGLLAPMSVHAPEQQPQNPADMTVPRVSVRSSGERGFLFCNNYVRNYSMPEWPAAQFEVRLPSGVLRVPREPITIPSGAYFIWPFNLKMGDAELLYSTSQLFTRLDDRTASIYYFAAVRGIVPEFAFMAAGLQVRTSSGDVHTENGVTYVSGIEPGVDSSIDLMTKEGTRTHIVILSADEAEHAWRVRLDEDERLLITDADLVVGSDRALRLLSREHNNFSFVLTPPPANAPEANVPLRVVAASARSIRFSGAVPERNPMAKVQQLRQAGEVPLVRVGPSSGKINGVAQAPIESDLAQAGDWSISIPADALNGISELILNIRYTGDVARLYTGDKLLDDDFFNGLDWNVGLQRFLDAKQAATLKLRILPLRQDAPVYFEMPHKAGFDATGQAARVESIRLVPVYELSLYSSAHADHAPAGSPAQPSANSSHAFQ
ncbi:MAG: beta-galactosidase [Terracidiphilus sp.]